MNSEPLSIGSSPASMLATSLNVSILLYQNHPEKVLVWFSLDSIRKIKECGIYSAIIHRLKSALQFTARHLLFPGELVQSPLG